MLTTAQQATLRTDITNNSDLNAQPKNGDGAFEVARLYNLVLSPTFNVYRSSIPVQEVFDAIVWANLTPADAPDGTQTWANRSLACQGKQFNLQTMLIGATGALNGAKPNTRAGLQDALINVPSGIGGALQAAGWVTVRDSVLARAGTRIEKLFATTAGGHDGSTAALAATMVIEGPISPSDVLAAWGV